MSNPFDVLSQFDRLASGVFDSARTPRLMPVDLFRAGDQYVLSADLPGIDPASVDLDVDGQLLTIRAERPAPANESVKWIVHERPHGQYMRQFTLGDGVDLEKITANYEHGVLSVIVPMAERAKPRKIEIASSTGAVGVAGAAAAGAGDAAHVTGTAGAAGDRRATEVTA